MVRATSVDPEAGFQGGEVVDVNERVHRQQQVESVVEIETAESSDLRLSGRDVKPIDEKPLRDDKVEERVNVRGVAAVDGRINSAAAATRVNATIVGGRDLETIVAGENLASSVVAGDLIDVGDVLAVLATGGATERRSNRATTTYNPAVSIAVRAARKKKTRTMLGIARNINALVTASIAGDTTQGLPSGARRIVALPLGGVLRVGGVL